ncbi:MAG TPA: UTP--glucose-1-phosphate uridylyltransferase [Candidatus Dojkabacteria bacterium]|jgi:UTP--glucose-1-phosphate uridylyltransferase
MKIKKAVITAAGFGSRFLPITKTIPKEMLPIIDKPIIHYLVEECKEAGIEEVIIVASPTEVATFENYFYGKAISVKNLMYKQGKVERWKKVEKLFSLPPITIVPQDESIPYGNGRPVLSVKELVQDEEAFVVIFGDDLVLSDISSVKQLIDYYEANPCDALLGVQRVDEDEVDRYGILKLKDGSENQVEKIVEKPSLEDAPSNLASYGRFILTPKIFEYLRSDRIGMDGEVWLQDANDELAKNGKVLYKEVEGEWMTTGDPFRYLKAHLKYALKDPEMKDNIINFINEMEELLEDD